MPSLDLVSKHFPKHDKLYSILNSHKISYSCTGNIKRIIQGHNKKAQKEKKKRPPQKNTAGLKEEIMSLNRKCNR